MIALCLYMYTNMHLHTVSQMQCKPLWMKHLPKACKCENSWYKYSFHYPRINQHQMIKTKSYISVHRDNVSIFASFSLSLSLTPPPPPSLRTESFPICSTNKLFCRSRWGQRLRTHSSVLHNIVRTCKVCVWSSSGFHLLWYYPGK